MKRRWFQILGIFLIIGQLTVLVAFGVPASSESGTIATFLTTGCAGILFAIGGTGKQFGAITWNQFVGAANIILGLMFVLGIVFPIWDSTSPYESSIQPVLTVAALTGGASLMFIGVDWIRGGRYFDLSSYESGPIFSRGETS